MLLDMKLRNCCRTIYKSCNKTKPSGIAHRGAYFPNVLERLYVSRLFAAGSICYFKFNPLTFAQGFEALFLNR